MGNFYLVKNNKEFSFTRLHRWLEDQIKAQHEDGNNAEIRVIAHETQRSLSANALYWMWLSQMAKSFTERGHTVDKDEMHLLMRNRFLGWHNTRKIGQTQINPTLKSTTELNKTEFCRYLEQIEAWATQHGCKLTSPISSEYREYLERQND